MAFDEREKRVTVFRSVAFAHIDAVWGADVIALL